MFHAIFGTSYYNIPNHIPESQGITSRRLMCFFIMWCAHLSLAFLRPYQLNKFFWAKMFLIVPGIVGLFIFVRNNCSSFLPIFTHGSEFMIRNDLEQAHEKLQPISNRANKVIANPSYYSAWSTRRVTWVSFIPRPPPAMHSGGFLCTPLMPEWEITQLISPISRTCRDGQSHCAAASGPSSF